MSYALTFDTSTPADIHVDAHVDARIRVTPIQEFVAIVAATCDRFTSTMKGGAMAYTLPADKMVGLKISYVDKNNNPATIDGAVVWQSSDPNIARVEPPVPPEADNSTVNLVPGTAVGNCQVSAQADADLGAGVRQLVTLLDVTIVGGEAVTGTITPTGEPVPLP